MPIKLWGRWTDSKGAPILQLFCDTMFWGRFAPRISTQNCDFEKSRDALLAAMRRSNCTDRHVFWCRFARWVDLRSQIALLSKLVAPATSFLQKQRSFDVFAPVHRLRSKMTLCKRNKKMQQMMRSRMRCWSLSNLYSALIFCPFELGVLGPKSHQVYTPVNRRWVCSHATNTCRLGAYQAVR